MRKTLLLTLIASSVAVSASTSVRREIELQYKKWSKATVKNDVEAILAGLTPDYTLKTYTGTIIDRKSYEESLKKRKASGKPGGAYVTKIASLTVDGLTAKVISDETSVTMSKDPITKKKLKVIHIHRYLDTWVKVASKWLLKSTVTQEESTKVVPATS